VAGVETQTRQAFANLENVLRAAGCTFADIVDMTIFMVDMPANFATVNAVKTERFPRPPFPAVTGIGVAALWGSCMVEIKVIARVPQATGDRNWVSEPGVVSGSARRGARNTEKTDDTDAN
jgi:enamine deaminase RidA (YjgF/YER057c/UK114 family)